MGAFFSFVRNSGIYILGSVLSKIVGFLMLPFYTAWIAPDEFGYYDVSLAYLAIVCEALFLNIWVVVLRFMYDFDAASKPKAIVAGAVTFLFSTGIYIGLALLIANLTDLPYFWLIVLYGILQNITMLFKFATRGFSKNFDFAISGVLGTILMALANIVLLIYFDLGIAALYYSMILSFVFEILFLEVRVGVVRKVMRLETLAPDRLLVRRMAVYAIPIGVNALGYWFIQSYNRVVISQTLSLEDNGMFSIASRFGGVVTLATVAMTYAWQELAFRVENQNGLFLSRASALYLFGLFAMASFLLPVINVFFDLIIDSQYSVAKSLVPSAILLGVVSGYSNFLVNILYGLKDSKTVMWTILISATFNFLSVQIFISWFGLNGANFSASLSLLVNIFLLHIVLRRRVQLEFSYLMAFGGLSLGFCTAIIYFAGAESANLVYFIFLFLSLATVATWLYRRHKN